MSYYTLTEMKELAKADLAAADEAIDSAAEASVHARPETADRLNREARARVRVAAFAWMGVVQLVGSDAEAIAEAGEVIRTLGLEAEHLGDREAAAEFARVARDVLAGASELQEVWFREAA